MRIAFIDIDGVIADATERFKQATVDGKIDWGMALNGVHVHLDTLIPGAKENLIQIAGHYNQTILLTSRYDHMEAATRQWLHEHDVIVPNGRIVTKPWNDRYVKTKLWKAQKALQICREFGQADLWQSEKSSIAEVLIVDDEEANCTEMDRLLSENASSLNVEAIIVRAGLQEAMEYIEKGIIL